MEPTIGMYHVPSHENDAGWEPSKIAEGALRRGQQLLYRLLLMDQKLHYTIQLPTGYGKSWCACIAYTVLRDQSRVTRMLLVVPSTQQKEQYLNTLHEDLHTLGIPYRGIEWCDGEPRGITSHRQNTADIFVTTVQAIGQCKTDYYDKLMSTGQWLMVADEYHHYSDENTWGTALKNLRCAVILGMSATPYRADGSRTFLDQPPDIEVTVAQAASDEEQAIRRVKASVADYFVDINKGDSEDVIHLTCSQLEKIADEQDISKWELQHKIRYNSDYLAPLLVDAVDTLHVRSIQHPGQHQMLIFAMSCAHAQHITTTLNALTGDPLFADWIGEGPNGRPASHNQRIIDTYIANGFPCLVQVNKAGEGFNNKRCSVGVFLNLIGDTPMARQQLGRFIRRNEKIAWDDDYATIFASQDARIVPLLLEYHEATQQDREEQFLIDVDSSGCETVNLRLYRIPDLFLVDVAFKDVQITWPYGGTPEKAVAHLQSQSQVFADMPYDDVYQMAKDILLKAQHPHFASERSRFKQTQDDVTKLTSTTASYALKLQYGREFPKELHGVLIRRLHATWIKDSRLSHKEMNQEQLFKKFQWLQGIANRMVDVKEVPAWLHI